MSLSSIISEPLQTERLPNGKRKLTRELRVSVGADEITVPAGFVTDYSSYPRALLVVFLTIFASIFQYGPSVFLLLLLIPKYSRVDVAGVVHDYLYQTGQYGKWKTDKIWLHIALSGKHRAYWYQAMPGWFIGLVVAGWYMWIKYRREENKE